MHAVWGAVPGVAAPPGHLLVPRLWHSWVSFNAIAPPEASTQPLTPRDQKTKHDPKATADETKVTRKSMTGE